MTQTTTLTSPTHSRIALIFDFDDTLAADSTSAFLKWFGIDPKKFWQERVQPLVKEGWDPLPAQFYEFIQISKKRELGRPITINLLREFGKQHQLFSGVEEMFSHLRTETSSIELEFYLLSSGIGEIICNTFKENNFKRIWTSTFHFNEEGEIDFPKVFITHTEKSRYLHRISKGLLEENKGERLFEANRAVSPENLHVPMNQMIYVGDGFTDVPCFELISKSNGIAVGVDKPHSEEKWGGTEGRRNNARVLNLAKPDYRPHSEMAKTLKLAIQSIESLILIKEMSSGE